MYHSILLTPGTLQVTCEASNGIASQDQPCVRTFSLELLRPPQPKQCDLAYEHGEFQMRCIPGTICFIVVTVTNLHYNFV